MKRFVCLALAVACLAVPPSTRAQETNAGQRTITEIEAAAILIQAGRLDDAKRVLAHVLQIMPGDNEAIFLTGMIAVSEKRYDDAIAAFRNILASEPDRERVRLELARAFFLEADYDNAERNFKFARAGDLPDEVKINIDQYLAVISRLKRWSFVADVALAEDTNANGATSARQVDIYGLPFTLSDNARQKSGTGFTVDIGGEWSPLLSPNTKARFGAHVHRAEYGGGNFDDMTISVYAGPQFMLGQWLLDAAATGFRRWYGNSAYSRGVGGRGRIAYLATPQLQLATGVDITSIAYEWIKDQNGSVVSGNLEATYTLSPSSFVRTVAGIGLQDARARAYANTVHWLSLDYYRDLPWGFSVNLEPALSWTGYDARLAAFGATRFDHAWALRVDLLNRRIEYGGFAPRLSFIHVTQSSNISLYNYDRNQIQVGMTRQF
jgi:tetratricopeptide (TPR) repeat protein